MPPLKDDDLGDEAAALALLSPEEREAMGLDDDETEIVNELAKGEDDDTPAPKGEDELGDDEGEDDEDEDDDTPPANPEPNPEPEPKPEDTPPADLPPLDLAPVEQNYQSKLESLDAEKAEAFQKLMDGEIDAKEYAQIESKYLRDRDALAEERGTNTAWFKEVHEFKNRAATEGVDYHKNPEHAESLDAWVKRLAAKPENADKDGTWFLTEAHRRVKIEFDIAAGGTPAQQKQADKQKNVSKQNGRAPKLDTIPPTLGNLPTATDSEAGDQGEFAHLERLSGMELEKALARMTPDQQERYLRD